MRRVANELGNKQFRRLLKLSVANVLAKSDSIIEQYKIT